MSSLSLESSALRLEIDPATGVWTGLYGGRTDRSWLRQDGAARRPGLPFVGGTGLDDGNEVALGYETSPDGALDGLSVRGEIRTRLAVDADALCCELELPDRRGPRSGWRLDLDHLDLEGGPVGEQLMPVCVATSESLDWAYIVWQRSEDDFLVTAVDGPFCAWRIHYSYGGHRMQGFELLARADEIICPADRFPGGRLPAVTRLRIKFSLAASRHEALEKAADLLGLAMLVPAATGGPVGASIALEPVGDVRGVELVAPDGAVREPGADAGSVELSGVGQHVLRVASASGRVHETRLLGLEGWRPMADRCLNFHREHYQLECGAFARILRSDTLLPDGRQFAAKHFGNPEEEGSCRTGEFGGFGAWAQMLHQRAFGADSAMASSVDGYFGWMLNRGREDNPRPGTVSYAPHSYNGRDYSPYHFFGEINYAQHEAWFIEQLADAVADGEEVLLPHLRGLCRHYLDDHCDDDGGIWNQNWVEETPVDYSTVDCPMTHLLAAGRLLEGMGDPLGTELLAFCRKQADHMLHRGFDFPTEGEPCTEDGSIACQAWGLAYAYNRLDDPDPAWLELAEALVAFHSKLEMSGTDVRSAGSSQRFWESLYESDNYGPSINAGHGWTLWTAFARWELYLATGRFDHLAAAWQHTLCAASTFDDRGASFPCFTPDLIPGAPHDDGWGDPAKRHEGRISSIPLAWGYPDTISMSGMFLFILAPQSWYLACGADLEDGSTVNARLEGDRLIPATAKPCRHLAFRGLPAGVLAVEGLDTEAAVQLTVDGAGGEPAVPTGAEDWHKAGPGVWTFRCPSGRIGWGG